MLKQLGFESVELVAETGFNSSPKTRGTLFRGEKALSTKDGKEITDVKDSLAKYQSFFDAAYAEGSLDRKTKHLVALGASLAAGCEQ